MVKASANTVKDYNFTRVHNVHVFRLFAAFVTDSLYIHVYMHACPKITQANGKYYDRRNEK